MALVLAGLLAAACAPLPGEAPAARGVAPPVLVPPVLAPLDDLLAEGDAAGRAEPAGSALAARAEALRGRAAALRGG